MPLTLVTVPWGPHASLPTRAQALRLVAGCCARGTLTGGALLSASLGEQVIFFAWTAGLSELDSEFLSRTFARWLLLRVWGSSRPGIYK